MASAKKFACPSPLRCRDPQSLRSCLTYFKKIEAGAILDFSKLQFVDPGALVLLHHLARVKKVSQVNVVYPDKEQTRQYLEDILEAGKPRSANKYPLRHIRREEDMMSELGRWRQMLQDSEALDEERARNFSATMSEVLMNSFSHGKTTSPCIVGGQTYPKQKHSVLAAVDYGRSIPKTLEECGKYGDREREDHEWLELALEAGVTCGSRETNKGLGLYYLADMITKNGGTMLIASRDGLLYMSGGHIVAESLGNYYDTFKGTFISLDIRTGA